MKTIISQAKYLTNKLRLLSWNIQSRNSKHEGNKTRIRDFNNIFINHDIVCFQESRKPIKLENFKTFNSNRPGGPKSGGGVAIMVRNEIIKGVSQYKTGHIPDVLAIKLKDRYCRGLVYRRMIVLNI